MIVERVSSCLRDISSKFILIAVTIAAVVLVVAETSVGDRSWIFQKCLTTCRSVDCVDEDKYRQSQLNHMQLLQWSCLDECKYSCMWQTVDAFQKDNSKIPQFYGKWPFVRVWGIQEPASVVFSILNGLTHLGIFYYRSKVPKETPMYYVWHVSAIISANAWFWSTVFHTRDKDFTEMMDYFCAFSLVLYSPFTFCCRFLGTQKLWRVVVLGVCHAALFFTHVGYLGLVKFDYGYNMKINLVVAGVNLFAWLLWCYKLRKKQPYVKKCAFVLISLQILVLLEVFDIPPFRWVFDAHSLWHAGTIPLSILWYSFITDDGVYLHAQQQAELYKLD